MAIAADFRERYGPWALVAGASYGIGAEFSRLLAERRFNLVLVAREAGVVDVAAALAARHGVETRPVQVDLATPGFLAPIEEATRGVDLGLLICNAAHSAIGPFLDQERAELTRIVDVNCRAPLLLCHTLGPRLRARGRGGIIIMSSLSAFQGSPLIATYAATKAWDLTFGEALADELREHGVDVLAFCAGATRTPSYEQSRPQPTGWLSAPVMEAAPVAEEALARLGTAPSAIAGRANRLAAFFLSRLLPRAAAVRLMGRTMRAMYPADR